MEHTVVATQLNTKRKYTSYTLVHTWYTTITAVNNIHSGAQHIHYTETFRLPERQVTLTMISVLILHFNISVLGVVVRGVKKHYVNVKTEQTLSTLQPRN